jgi:hypothetical protein
MVRNEGFTKLFDRHDRHPSGRDWSRTVEDDDAAVINRRIINSDEHIVSRNL